MYRIIENVMFIVYNLHQGETKLLFLQMGVFFMYAIANGIKVYYKNCKDFSNIVFFYDELSKYYDDGEMLLELISDESVYMMTEKTKNMIMAFPNKNAYVSEDSIGECFKWLYDTINDDDILISTELFRSSFNDIVNQVLENLESENECETVEDFFMECYKIYEEYIDNFYILVKAVAANASGIADDFQKAIAESFILLTDDYKTYTEKCHVQRKDGYTIVETIHIKNLFQLLAFEYCRMKKSRKAIKECVNCGRLFIPIGRIDTIYCSSPAPKYWGKTCKDIGAQLRRTKKRQSNLIEHEHHNKICQLYNAIRREKERKGSNDIISYYRQQIDAEVTKYVIKK